LTSLRWRQPWPHGTALRPAGRGRSFPPDRRARRRAAVGDWRVTAPGPLLAEAGGGLAGGDRRLGGRGYQRPRRRGSGPALRRISVAALARWRGSGPDRLRERLARLSRCLGCRLGRRLPTGVPHPADHDDLVLFRRRRHSAPHVRLAEIAHLRNQ
jgi:hypothetical protein